MADVEAERKPIKLWTIGCADQRSRLKVLKADQKFAQLNEI
jgi:hypothetical protein